MPYVDERAKVLGQSNPPANTLTDVYTVPSDRDAVISTISVSNREDVESWFSVSIAVLGAPDDLKQYVYYRLPAFELDTFAATVGYTLTSGDVIRVVSGSGNLSFSIYGSEVKYVPPQQP